LGHAKEAEQEYQQALAIDQGVTGSSPPAEIEYTRADAYFGLGDVEAVLAATARGTDRQIEHWRQARSYYQKSLETWKGIPNPGYLSPQGFSCGSPTKSSQAVVIADAALAKLRGSTRSQQLRAPVESLCVNHRSSSRMSDGETLNAGALGRRG